MSAYIQYSIFGEHSTHQGVIQHKKKNPEKTIKQKNFDLILQKLNFRNPKPNSPVIVSFGGGTNSTALIILCWLKKIHIDAIVFADTGDELPETYNFLEWFDGWLESKNLPKLTVIRYEMKTARPRQAVYKRYDLKWKTWDLFWLSTYCTFQLNYFQQNYKYKTLGENCLLLEHLPSKAYNSGACSAKWKVEVIRRFSKSNYPGCQVVELVGIHFDERSRLLNKSGHFKPLEGDFFYSEYPLIKNRLTQNNCEALCRNFLGFVPKKSACWFCPNAKISEVIDLKESHPDLYELGCYMEELADKHIKSHGIKGLGRSFSWRNLENLTPIEKTLIDSQKAARKCQCTD